MIYLAGKPVKEIFLGNRPISCVFLADKLIYRSSVYLDAGEVIILQSMAMLRSADGVTCTVEASNGFPVLAKVIPAPGDSCQNRNVPSVLAVTRAVPAPGDSSRVSDVLSIPVVAKPYMRYIAPMQSAPPQTIISENAIVLTPSEIGRNTAIGTPGQVGSITPGQVENSDIGNIGTGVSYSTPIDGIGDDLWHRELIMFPYRSNAIEGAAEILRSLRTASGFHTAKAIKGIGDDTEQQHEIIGIYVSEALEADGKPRGSTKMASGMYAAEGIKGVGANIEQLYQSIGAYRSKMLETDGRLYAVRLPTGAMPKLQPINGAEHDLDLDVSACAASVMKLVYGEGSDIAVYVPVGAPLSDLAPMQADIVPASCDNQTPTSIAEMKPQLLAAISGVVSTDGMPTGTETEPAVMGVKTGIGITAVVIGYAARMITRLLVFDEARVADTDTLTIDEIDLMVLSQ